MAPILFFLFACIVHATEIPTTRQLTPMLGQGYLSERQMLAGECLTGTPVLEGSPEASISYTSSISEQQLASELGMSAGAKTRLGIMQTSASANFLNASKSDGFSISAIYMGTYFFKNRILKNPKTAQENLNAERWREACGDEFVSQQTLGAKLFFSIRIDFLSEQEKNAFSASFSFDSPLASAGASVNRAVSSLSKRTKVTINVLQIGGNVDRITEIFQAQDSTAYQFVQCSSGNFEKCQEVLAQAISYATNIKSGFPSQISPETNNGPAVLSSTTQPYQAAHIFVEMTPELDAQVKLSRQLISQKYEATYQQYTRARRLLRDSVIRLSSRQRDRLSEMERSLFSSLQYLTESSLRCFNHPKQCSDTYRDINGALYTEKDFLIEPEIFSQYCDLGLSPLAPKPLTNSISSLIQIAKKLEPDLFLPPYEEAIMDTCHVAELIYMRTNHLSLEGHNIEDLRPIGTLAHMKTLDLRESPSETKCPFEDSSKCLRADFRNHNSFIQLHKATSTPRMLHAATPLANGNVLITGREKRAEIFDPQTARFRLSSEQIFPRYYHTATLLKTGDVLLIGGFGRNASQSAERFDAHEEQFVLNTHAPLFDRASHTATLLSDGRVLVIGGWSNRLGIFTGLDATCTVEIYDPQTQKFTQVASMHLPRASHKATLLNNNLVLVTGGYTPNGSLTSAEIYNPATNGWHFISERMHQGRFEHTATLMQDGRILIAGGFTDQAEIFDPKTHHFEKLEHPMNEIRGEHEAFALSDGKIVIMGGRRHNQLDINLEGDHIESAHASAEIFDPISQLFTRLPHHMSTPRAAFTISPIGQNKILLVGGLGALASHSAELFEYTTGSSSD
ncbi:MAG: hypothetical protein JKY15_06375 [Deltaproteobacteria bacterium]|nr:hypothetical protein [Deltaproteobacteria bacterium]